MISLEYHIEYKYGQTIKLRPIFDVHWGNKYCVKKDFIEFLSLADNKTYFIGGGDLFDAIILKDWRYAKSQDETLGDDFLDTHVIEMAEILRPYKDRIIGLGIGNHEKTVLRNCNTNLVKRVCSEIGVPYLGYTWVITLHMREARGRGRDIVIKGHHGWGGGSRTRGADITKYEKDMGKWADVDIFLYGHVHKVQYDKTPMIKTCGGRLKAVPRIMAICGTFLKTFSDGVDTTYSEDEGYPPCEVGGIELQLKPNGNGVKINATL
jgi:hypothetical protein